MTLKDLLKKKDKVEDEGASANSPPKLSPDVPEFQFMRTTTLSQETIEPPSFPGDPTREVPSTRTKSHHFGVFRSHSTATSQRSSVAERLHIGRNRSKSSAHVPENLPAVKGDGVARTEDDEASWEQRATVLVTAGLQHGTSPSISPAGERPDPMGRSVSTRSNRSGSVGTPADEVLFTIKT